jgi:hypothetical protein
MAHEQTTLKQLQKLDAELFQATREWRRASTVALVAGKNQASADELKELHLRTVGAMKAVQEIRNALDALRNKSGLNIDGSGWIHAGQEGKDESLVEGLQLIFESLGAPTSAFGTPWRFAGPAETGDHDVKLFGGSGDTFNAGPFTSFGWPSGEGYPFRSFMTIDGFFDSAPGLPDLAGGGLDVRIRIQPPETASILVVGGKLELTVVATHQQQPSSSVLDPYLLWGFAGEGTPPQLWSAAAYQFKVGQTNADEYSLEETTSGGTTVARTTLNHRVFATRTVSAGEQLELFVGFSHTFSFSIPAIAEGYFSITSPSEIAGGAGLRYRYIPLDSLVSKARALPGP